MAAGILNKCTPNLYVPQNKSSSSSFLSPQSLKSSFNSDFHGFTILLSQAQRKPSKGYLQNSPIQMSFVIGKAHRWWKKGVQPNMKEITCADDLVTSLLMAGNQLVIVDFFSPGCGGCKALHPKICQFAEMNRDVQFLQVNYEEHKPMCYSLNVHVLPFFRFYRGAHGRLCSFSCTNATLKKFRDALAKHSPDRCSLGPTRGLEEAELVALAANRELCFNYTPKRTPLPVEEPEPEAEAVPADIGKYPPLPSKWIKESEEKTLVTSGN